jgi:thioredoxin 1
MIVAENTTFETEVLSATEPAVVYFWATWCQSCKLMTPQMEKLAAENEGRYRMVKVEIGENPELAEKYEIMSTPTIMMFKPEWKEPQTVQAGYAAKGWVSDLIETYLNKK